MNASLLEAFQPWEAQHHRDHVAAIGRWIGQKFDRLALPDSVVEALNDSGVREALENALKRNSTGILDVRVLLDEKGAQPVVNFLLICDATGRVVAEDICKKVENRANAAAQKLDGRVTIGKPRAIGEDALTYAQWRKTHAWRIDYMSLRTTPSSNVPPR